MHVPEKLPHETSREYALRAITENIVSLELAPGSTVSENEISIALGLSRTPVREALIELSKTNIVEILPQRGSRISLVDYAMVDESRFVRVVFESEIVKICCEIATEKDLKKLEDNLKLQELYCCDEHHYGDFMQADNEFHRTLFEIANKTQTYHLMNSLAVHFDRVRTMSLCGHDKNLNIRNYQGHREIYSAIKDKDAERAKELIVQHLSRYKEDASEVQKEYPQYIK